MRVFVREATSRRADGSTVTYLQLVESVWDREKSRSVHRVVHNFGRKDALDIDGVRRLVTSLSRYLPEGAQQTPASDDGRRVLATRPLGTALLIEGLWKSLGLDGFFRAALKRRGLLDRYERALLGMVVNRAVDPRSKLGAYEWLRAGSVHFDGADALELQDFYRALDVVADLKGAMEERLWSRTCDLFGVQVDLVFYDTTSSYFEIDDGDDLRRRGKSKDYRGHLPQIVVGVAVNEDALPLRHWVHRGNTADVSTVKGAIKDLAGLGLRRVVFVGDRAMGSRDNLSCLREAKIPYLIGAKLRDGSRIAKVLARAGRYHEVLDNLDVKEVVLGDERFVVCRNEEAAERERAVRERILLQIEQDLRHPKTAKKALAHRIKSRYLAQRKGQLVVDWAKARREERLDGKSIVLVGDPSLSPEEAALGYRGRWRVESAIRHMKSFVELRPIHHRDEERIRAHVAICVLSYFLQRLTEIRAKETWPRIRDELQQLTAVTWTDGAATVVQSSEPSPKATQLLAAVGLTPPARLLSVGPASA